MLAQAGLEFVAVLVPQSPEHGTVEPPPPYGL